MLGWRLRFRRVAGEMSSGRILVADDGTSVRDVVGYALHQEGFDVTLAAPGRHVVRVGDEPVNLPRSEFQVLRLLAERPGQGFSRLEIMEELWQSEFSGDVRACDVHISNLRQKVERDPQDPELVLTVRGVGYRLAGAPGS